MSNLMHDKVNNDKNNKNTKCYLKVFLNDLKHFSFILRCNTFLRRSVF